MNVVISKIYNTLLSTLSSFISNAYINLNYYLGNLDFDLNNKRQRHQSCMDNEIRRIITYIVGEERKRSIMLRVEVSPEETSDELLLMSRELNKRFKILFEHADVYAQMLQVLQQGLISGCALIKINTDLTCEASPLYTPSGTVFDFASSSINMNKCKYVFTSKIYDVDEIKAIIHPQFWNIIEQYRGKNTNVGYYNSDEFNNQSLESTTFNNANYYVDDSQIRIVEGYIRNVRILAVPTTSYSNKSHSGSRISEKLLIISEEEWKHKVPYALFSPEINSQCIDHIENRFSTPTSSARGLQYYLNELLLYQMRIISTQTNLLVVKETWLESNLDAIFRSTTANHTLVKIKQDAPVDTIQHIRSAGLDSITIQQIQQIKDSLMSTFGLSGQVLGEYRGSQQTSFALEHLREKTAHTTVSGIKRNFHDAYIQICKKLIYMYLLEDQTFSEGQKKVIFRLLDSGALNFKLKESFDAPLEKDYSSYLHLLEISQKYPVPVEDLIKYSPIEEKETLIISLNNSRDAEIKLAERERKILEKEKELEFKEKIAEIEKIKAETKQIESKKETENDG